MRRVQELGLPRLSETIWKMGAAMLTSRQASGKSVVSYGVQGGRWWCVRSGKGRKKKGASYPPACLARSDTPLWLCLSVKRNRTT
jgi:hypothetical protein